ncbi:phosphoribosyltransferase [Agrobacterium fabrum]|uniref:phosphoribosyltransferase n=1 Tax=Agrobacterium fabrum TaxID=1176649 RepID=UPI00273D4643|nr:phosphoribosyltransferase [Agrobacterium fabrum]WLP54083.1 phosphoribosyltransferase [Agrobacterium fabrum]
MQAALELLDELVVKDTIEKLQSIQQSLGRAPYLIAPAAQLGDSNNALAIGYANWLSHELEWPVEERVFQMKEFSKDKSNGWVRIAHRSQFYGEIDKGAPYVIVDDVMTLGGTLADLRSFILSKGGDVIGMSTIASKDGIDTPIHLGAEMQEKLEKCYGKDFAEFCDDLLGHDHTCLTRPEASRILDCASHVVLRKKVVRGRDEGNASRSKRVA